MASDEDSEERDPKDRDEEDLTSAETVDAKRAVSSKPPAPADDDDEDDDATDEDEDEASDTADEDDDAESVAASAKDGGKSDPPVVAASVKPRMTGSSSPYREQTHDHDHHHEFAHVTPVKLLVGVLAVLLVLTVATVAVTAVDLGSQGNLVVAMVIATIKAALVVTFFMHLLWDKRFHLLVFLSSVLFLILFIGLALTDRREYQPAIDAKDTETLPPGALPLDRSTETQ